MRGAALRRGQATLELAIGALLVVTMLIGGLHLAEVWFLSLKVQEASAAAVWEATGHRIHDFTNPNSGVYVPYGNLSTNVESRTQARYGNFDAVVTGGAPQRLFTRGTGMTVTCARPPAAALRFAIPAAGSPSGSDTLLRGWYRDVGQIACTSSAEALPFNLPVKFMTRSEKGFFKRDLVATAPIKLCGVGRTLGGTCKGHYSLLLGDWSLDGATGSPLNKNYPVQAAPGSASGPGQPQVFTANSVCRPNGYGKANAQYCNMVKDLWEKSGKNYRAGDATYVGAASDFANKIAGPVWGSIYPAGSPYEEQKFSMSFAGVEGDPALVGLGTMPPAYIDELNTYRSKAIGRKDYNAAYCESCHFNTTGTQPVNASPMAPDDPNNYQRRRRTCFLGLGNNGCQDKSSNPGLVGG